MKFVALSLLIFPLMASGHDKRHAPAADTGSDYVVRLSAMTAIEAGKGEKIPKVATTQAFVTWSTASVADAAMPAATMP